MLNAKDAEHFACEEIYGSQALGGSIVDPADQLDKRSEHCRTEYDLQTGRG
jgi:hypothetical protein